MAEEVIKNKLSELEGIYNELYDDYGKWDAGKKDFPIVNIYNKLPMIGRAYVAIEVAFPDFDKLKYANKLNERIQQKRLYDGNDYRKLIHILGSFIEEVGAKLKLNVLKKETKKSIPSFVHP